MLCHSTIRSSSPLKGRHQLPWDVLVCCFPLSSLAWMSPSSWRDSWPCSQLLTWSWETTEMRSSLWRNDLSTGRGEFLQAAAGTNVHGSPISLFLGFMLICNKNLSNTGCSWSLEGTHSLNAAGAKRFYLVVGKLWDHLMGKVRGRFLKQLCICTLLVDRILWIH